MACCICLEPPLPSNPLYLLSCGCKISWFHKSCEENWLSYIPLAEEQWLTKCPTCRQNVPLKYNYSFSYYAGEEQRYLWITAILFLADIFISLYNNQKILALESSCIVLFPFIIRSTKDVSFFLMSYRIRFMMDYFLVVSSFPYIEKRFVMLQQYRLLHLIVLTWFTTYKKPHINPLTPFAISADVIHKDILELPKRVPNPLKRNKRRSKS